MKQRIDQLLVERGLALGATEAAAMVMAGEVILDGRRVDKPGTLVASDREITLKKALPYVSRAGEKLASVAEQLRLDLGGKVVLDVGSSTGGFTDYCLQHGAVRVYAVDVGNNQLDYRLRQDPRVVVMERTDIRSVIASDAEASTTTPLTLSGHPDLAVVDVSFISLTKVLEHVATLIKPGGYILAMAKPQFEADKPTADRFHGVIDDEEVRQQILTKLRTWLNEHFEVVAEADSGLRGAKGNLERFYLLTMPTNHHQPSSLPPE